MGALAALGDHLECTLRCLQIDLPDLRQVRRIHSFWLPSMRSTDHDLVKVNLALSSSLIELFEILLFI